MDRISPEKRSAVMARVRGKNTAPEMKVRRLAHRLGFRFRLHRRDLPGTPDLVFPRLQKVIFVHGCFWHLHELCNKSKLPSANAAFWEEKLIGNRQRDRINIERLEMQGWNVLVIWECETKNTATLEKRVADFLSDKC